MSNSNCTNDSTLPIHTHVHTVKRYIEAAELLYPNSVVLNNEEDPPDFSVCGGAWVRMNVWISDDEVEPDPGPSYDVWIVRFLSEGDGWSDWQHCTRFICDDDPEGRSARWHAHEYADHLRRCNPGSLVAVRAAESGPPKMLPHHTPPISHGT